MGIGTAIRKLVDIKTKQAVAVWEFNTTDKLIAPPATYKNTIIVGTRKGRVMQLNNKGEIIWTFHPHENVSSQEALFLDEDNVYGINDEPLIFSNENQEHILVVSEFGILYCLSNEGKLEWKVETDGPLRASPKISMFSAKSERIFLGSHDGFVYIVTLEGKVEHKFEVGTPIETRPVITGEQIIVGTAKGEVVSLDREGRISWRFKTGDKIVAHMTIAELRSGQGLTLLVGSQDKQLYALSLDGEPQWTFQTEGTILAQPIAFDINNDGHKEILLASCDNRIYCLTAFGEEIWSYETDFWITTAPLVADIDGDGTIEVVVGSLDSKVYVFDGQGSYKLDYIPGLGGIVHQTGHYSGNMNKDVGKNQGKLLCEFQTDNDVVGCTYLKSSKTIIAGTKKGKIYNIKVN